MQQAASLDGNSAFNYAIAGHDVDYNGIDGTAQSACCQCYQLVYDSPSQNDRQALVNPDDPNNNQSAIQPLPPPVIVQSFNMGATTDSFDIFMAAGGFGANNACDPKANQQDASGEYIYTSFPPDGWDNGGVKGATKYSECKTAVSWVTTASLSTPACQSRIQTECNMFAAPSATTTADSIRSCTQSNNPQTYYHLNWNVWAMKVECPTHLTDLTGCKLAPPGASCSQPERDHSGPGSGEFLLPIEVRQRHPPLDLHHGGLLHAQLCLPGSRYWSRTHCGRPVQLVLFLRSERRALYAATVASRLSFHALARRIWAAASAVMSPCSPKADLRLAKRSPTLRAASSASMPKSFNRVGMLSE